MLEVAFLPGGEVPDTGGEVEAFEAIALRHISLAKVHSGAFYGILPTGKSISTSVIRIDRVQDGKITEHWSVSDAAGLMQQIQS
jgi:predicted ester cyclase